MTSVVVTDGGERSALAVVRSLGSAGYEVHVCAARVPSLAGSSRFAVSERVVPDPLEKPEAFVEAVAERVRDTVSDLLLPVVDASVTAILSRRERFADTVLPFPSLQSYRGVSNKEEVAAAALELGIRVPRQSICDSVPPRSNVLAGLEFPVVVKPSRSVVAVDGRLQKTRVTYAKSPEALTRSLDRLPGEAFPVLLQERVEGAGIGVFLFVWNGRILAHFGHRRLREKPPSGGVSVLRESVPVPPELLEKSRALLERFHWSGVAMVEYKGVVAGEQPALMEVNGRFWGSLQLAVDAGVDFPRLLVEAALGGAVEPRTTYRSGVRCRWFWGDVDHLIARLRHSREKLSLPPGSPGRLSATWNFVRALGPGTRGEIFRWNDPWPSVRETMDWVRRR